MTPSNPIIPYGFCHCGCGQKTPIAQKTRSRSGHVKGQPCRYVRYHYRLTTSDIEKLKVSLTRHGHLANHCRTSTYNSWRAMMERCYGEYNQAFNRYGGVGILVCQRWKSFEHFLEDMGERPLGMTLDRFPDPSGNYEPANCRWATPLQQRHNRGQK